MPRVYFYGNEEGRSCKFETGTEESTTLPTNRLNGRRRFSDNDNLEQLHVNARVGTGRSGKGLTHILSMGS